MNAKNQQRPSYTLKPAVVLLLLSLFAVHGCAVAIIGVGAGAGAFAYYNGKLTRTYESSYHETLRAGKDALEKLNIPILETTSDELKTEIRAKRQDGTPVAIEIVRAGRDQHDVSVRTGVVGVWDRRASRQIHDHIGAALGSKTPLEEKPLEGAPVEKAQSVTVGEEIVVEDLAEESAPEPKRTETKPGPAVASLEEKRLKAAQMLVDSPYYIFFEKDSNALSQKSMQKLDRIYAMAAENDAARLTLNGYSDSYGEPAYNQMISELRASAVKSYLVAKGIAPSRMTIKGNGAQKPIASNKSAEGRKMNRRVEIKISEDPDDD